MTRYFLVAATVGLFAMPAMAGDVGVHAGPVGAGVTVGAARDHDRDRTTVIKEREPRDRTTRADSGSRSKDRRRSGS